MALPGQLADSGVHTSPASPFLAEKEMLVGSIRRFPGVGIHAATIEAVRDFLIRFNDEGGIPWFRIYHSFPAWQQECGLLTEQWDKDTMFEGVKVIFTLLDAHGGRFSREALVRDGTWITKAAQTIPNQVVVSKLYYKTGGSGFTLFEFRLTTELQPRVAICVLYQTNYRRVIRDLKQYVLQGWFPGQNQGNTRMQPIDPDYHLDGSLSNPRIDYTYNLASNNWTYIPGANQADQMVVQLEKHYLAHSVGGLTSGSQPDYTTNPVPNSESSGYHPPAETETQMSWPINDMYDDMLWETNMLTGQHSQADGMPTKSYYDNTLFGNSSMHASTPIQNAMANVNEPLLGPLYLGEDYSMATAHDQTQDGMLHFEQTDGYGELPDPFHRGKII